MTTIEKLQDLTSIETLRDAWQQLRGSSEFQALSIDQYVDTTSFDEHVLSRLVIVVRDGDRVIAVYSLAVFD